MALTRLVPMLHVVDVERSLAFYRDRLDFTLLSPEAAVKEWGWAHIRRDGVSLMLAGGLTGGPIREKGDTGSDWPVMFYFYPDDVVALHGVLKARGVEVGDLCVTFYRMKEFSCLDPDGHMLTFGQETDEPPRHALKRRRETITSCSQRRDPNERLEPRSLTTAPAGRSPVRGRSRRAAPRAGTVGNILAAGGG